MAHKQRLHDDAHRLWRAAAPRADLLAMNTKGFDRADERRRQQVIAPDESDLDASQIEVHVTQGEVKDGWGEDWEGHLEWTSGATRGPSPTAPDCEGDGDHRRMR